MADYSNLSDQALEEKLNAGKRTQMIVGVIFSLIILAWLFLGYWRDNTPVFIITVVLAVGIFYITGNGPKQISAELEKRNLEN